MQKNLKAAFYTLGCKLNFSETSAIARQLQSAGFETVDFNQVANLYVINTCSVTENADKECRVIVNRALAVNPDSFIVVTGCFAQLKPQIIACMPGVDLVLGANEKFNISAFLDDLTKREVPLIKACEIADVNHFQQAWSEGTRTRSFLKVQDGCDYSCSFCTIPLARGGSRSDSLLNVLKNIRSLVNKGVHEIVLTGVNLGDFGKASPASKHEFSFFDLAKAIDALPVKVRIRISSIEPNLLNKSIIDLVAISDKFMPHFHIPLQSGSDKILRLMKRRYLRDLYSERIAYIKNVMPHACIGADVIVGFPGETDDDFNETYQYINGLDVSYLHVFTYSERDHTPASSLTDVVPFDVRKNRNRKLRILSENKLREFYRSQTNRISKVLFESRDKDGLITGFTENYIKVRSEYHPELERTTQEVKLSELDDSGNFIFALNKNLAFN